MFKLRTLLCKKELLLATFALMVSTTIREAEYDNGANATVAIGDLLLFRQNLSSSFLLNLINGIQRL